MPLLGMTEPEIDSLAQEMLDAIPETGFISNKELHDKLGREKWPSDLYWAIRNLLIKRGKIEKSRGRGGRVCRVAPSNPDEPINQGAAQAPERLVERDLYEPMRNVIESQWVPDHGFDGALVQVTAQGGRRPDGKWARPDVTLAGYKTYPYVPGKQFDVITFEIKPHDSLDVSAVYEALAHRRAATRAYALLHVPQDRRAELEGVLEEIVVEGEKLGIGVIVAGVPNDYATWEELVEPVRHEPDAERLNEFLGKQIDPIHLETIVKWFR